MSVVIHLVVDATESRRGADLVPDGVLAARKPTELPERKPAAWSHEAAWFLA